MYNRVLSEETERYFIKLRNGLHVSIRKVKMDIYKIGCLEKKKLNKSAPIKLKSLNTKKNKVKRKRNVWD